MGLPIQDDRNVKTIELKTAKRIGKRKSRIIIESKDTTGGNMSYISGGRNLYHTVTRILSTTDKRRSNPTFHRRMNG